MLKFLESLNRALNTAIHMVVELVRFALRGAVESGLLAGLVAGGQVIGQLLLAPFLGQYSVFVALLWSGAFMGVVTGLTTFIGYLRNGGYHNANRSVFNPESRDAIAPLLIIYGANLLFYGLNELGFAASLSFKGVALGYWACSVLARAVMALSESAPLEPAVSVVHKEKAKVADESAASPSPKNKPAYVPTYNRKKSEDFVPLERKLSDLNKKNIVSGPKKSDK